MFLNATMLSVARYVNLIQNNQRFCFKPHFVFPNCLCDREFNITGDDIVCYNIVNVSFFFGHSLFLNIDKIQRL